MKALFLTKYGRAGASSRYRVYNYIPYIESRGWEAAVEPLLPDAYIASLYAAGRPELKHAAKPLLDRFLKLSRMDLGEFDAILVQYEIFPRLPFAVEKAFYRRYGHKVLVDYDDATFAVYEKSALLKNKIGRVMGGARLVIAGNAYLAAYARKYAREVARIPTVLDLSRYAAKTQYRGSGGLPVVGWIGTPITAEYLRHAAEAFRLAARRADYTLRCIGAPPEFSIPGVRVETRPWTEATEAAEIRQFDIGVMPLPVGSFTAGKCAFKLIQCMACGVPSIGTALGANSELIRDGVNGLLASTYEEFAGKLCGLLKDEDLRARLGREGRITVENEYSLDVTAPRFLNLLNQVAAERQDARKKSFVLDPGLAPQ